MAGQRPLEVITPPNMLRVKAGGRIGLNLAAVERAEAALRSMAGEFDKWIRSEVEALEEARDAVLRDGFAGEARDSLYRRAHDLKGMGGSYGYPIVTRIAGLLCLLLDSGAEDEAAARLAIAHIEAIRAAVRDEVKDSDHPVGQALVLELERQVQDICAAA